MYLSSGFSVFGPSSSSWSSPSFVSLPLLISVSPASFCAGSSASCKGWVNKKSVNIHADEKVRMRCLGKDNPHHLLFQPFEFLKLSFPGFLLFPLPPLLFLLPLSQPSLLLGLFVFSSRRFAWCFSSFCRSEWLGEVVALIHRSQVVVGVVIYSSVWPSSVAAHLKLCM